MRFSWRNKSDMLTEVEAAAGDYDKLEDTKYQLEIAKTECEEYIWWLETAIEEAEELIKKLDE